MKAAELKIRLELRMRKRARPPEGLSGTGEDGWIIELGARQIEGLSIGIGHGRASTEPALMKK